MARGVGKSRFYEGVMLMSTNIYRGEGGGQKLQNLIYVENGWPLFQPAMNFQGN